jgi:hypothetical protein
VKGPNTLLLANRFGGHLAVANSVNYGMAILGQADEGRQRHVYYTHKVVDDNFSVEFVFTKYAEYKEFTNWLMVYCARVSLPSSGLGPMRVLIPNQKFDKFGIPTDGITMGDDTLLTSWRCVVNFQGTEDPTNWEGNIASRYVDPTNPSSTLAGAFFYPVGVTLVAAGLRALPVDTLYDVAPADRNPNGTDTLVNDYINRWGKVPNF